MRDILYLQVTIYSKNGLHSAKSKCHSIAHAYDFIISFRDDINKSYLMKELSELVTYTDSSELILNKNIGKKDVFDVVVYKYDKPQFNFNLCN